MLPPARLSVSYLKIFWIKNICWKINSQLLKTSFVAIAISRWSWRRSLSFGYNLTTLAQPEAPLAIILAEEKTVTRLLQIVHKSICYQELRQPPNSLRAQGKQVGNQILLLSTRWKIIFYLKSFWGLDCYNDSQKENMPPLDLRKFMPTIMLYLLDDMVPPSAHQTRV